MTRGRLERHMTGRNGWIIFLGTACLIDAFWPSDELLSKQFDRFRAKHPVLAWYFILATANHFLRISPPRLDIYQLVYFLRPARHWVKRAQTRALPLWDAVHDPLSVEVDS